MFKRSPLVTYAESATAALRQGRLRQGLLDGAQAELSGSALLELDSILGTYSQVDVDWQGIWRAADWNSVGIPTFGHRPYWVPDGPGGAVRPLSALAFWAVPARLRIAQDPTTGPTVLGLMAGDQSMTGVPDPNIGDPHPKVLRAAARARKCALQIVDHPPNPPEGEETRMAYEGMTGELLPARITATGILECSVILGQSWGVAVSDRPLDDWEPPQQLRIIDGFPMHLFTGQTVDLQDFIPALLEACADQIPGINLEVVPGAGFKFTDPDSFGGLHFALEVSYVAEAYRAWMRTLSK